MFSVQKDPEIPIVYHVLLVTFVRCPRTVVVARFRAFFNFFGACERDKYVTFPSAVK